MAGPHVRAACRRHLKDLERQDIVWDLAAVTRAVGFFRDVLHLNGGQFEGRRFELHPSQAFIVASLFGWKRRDGRRRFKRAYVEQAKGNGKSPLAAGIGLYGLVADREPRAEIYAGARTKDQAMILFRDAVAMVSQSPALAKRLTPSGGNPVWNLADLNTGSFFRPISSDDGKSGPRPHVVLIDEVHEHRDRLLIEMLELGFKWRLNPLLVMITNSGSDRNSVCYEEHVNAVAAASGDHDDDIQHDQSFGYVCALDEGDDPLSDPSCWVKANPLLGVTQRSDVLAAAVSQARAVPGRLNNILRLHFCVWTDAETAWIERSAIEACEDPDLNPDEFDGVACYGGLDLSATRDMTGMALVWPDGKTEEEKPRFAAWVHGFMPGDGLAEKGRIDKAPYEVWARQEFITATPGKATRLDVVAKRCVEVHDRHGFAMLAYDSWLYSRFDAEVGALGVDLPVVEHPQGWNRRRDSNLSMPDSITALEQLILERRIRIGISPALRSAMTGARFETSPVGLRKFAKQKATRRIDLAVALAMAVGAATTNEAEDPGSVYETRGIVELEIEEI